MCGRYVHPDDLAIEREFNLVRQDWQFPPSFNVAPTQEVPVIRVAKDGSIQGKPMKWGLIPFWARGVPLQYKPPCDGPHMEYPLPRRNIRKPGKKTEPTW